MLKMEEMNAETAEKNWIRDLKLLLAAKRKNVNNYIENPTQGIGALVVISPKLLERKSGI